MAFDIQTDQREGLRSIMEADYGLEIRQDVPIVTMRMTHINGERVEAIQDSSETIRIPNWLYQREVRATYRDEITDAERITRGEWIGYFDDFEGLVPISIEEGVAGEMGIELGDEFTFNVQGIPMQTYVASFRGGRLAAGAAEFHLYVSLRRAGGSSAVSCIRDPGT